MCVISASVFVLYILLVHLESRITSLLQGLNAVAKIYWCHSHLQSVQGLLCFQKRFPYNIRLDLSGSLLCHQCTWTVFFWYACKYPSRSKPFSQMNESTLQPIISPETNSLMRSHDRCKPHCPPSGTTEEWNQLCAHRRKHRSQLYAVFSNMSLRRQWMALFRKINIPLKLHYVASFMLCWMSEIQINQKMEKMLWPFMERSVFVVEL